MSAQNPQVVKQMLDQIGIESRKTGAAYSHFPLQITPENPRPEGKVISVKITSDAGLSKQKLPVLTYEFPIMPDQYLEYDMMVDSTTTLAYTYLSLMKSDNLTFENNGVNTDGKLLRSSPIKSGVWKRVAVGLCCDAPLTLGKFGLGFKFKTNANATVYIDNIRIKNMKGEIVHEIFVDQLSKTRLISANASVVML